MEAMPKASELRSRGLSAATPPVFVREEGSIPKGSQSHASVIPSGSGFFVLRLYPGVSLRSTPGCLCFDGFAMLAPPAQNLSALRIPVSDFLPPPAAGLTMPPARLKAQMSKPQAAPLGAEEPLRVETVDIERSGELDASNPYQWTVVIDGTSDEGMFRDPGGFFFPWRQDFWNSISLSMENTGNETIRSPWITTANAPNFFSMRTLFASVIPPDATEEEKALALFDVVLSHVFHEVEGTGDNQDPIRLLNCYGQGICGDSAIALTALWEAAGLKTRAGRPLGHSTTEVEIAGRYRYLDGDLSAWVLLADNHTLAGEEDLARDPWLMKRAHTYGLKLWNWDPERDELAAALFWYQGDRRRRHPASARHTMAMNLRPGEKITWLWEEQFSPLPDFSPRSGPSRDIAGKWFHGRWDSPQPPGDGTERVIPFQLPYPIIGLRAEGLEEGSVISVSANGKDPRPVTAVSLRAGLRERAFLEALGRPDSEPPPYALNFKVAGQKSAFRIILDFQVAPLSLPAVHLGGNIFQYTDRSDKRSVRIEYQWRENFDNRPPEVPTPEWPAPGEAIPENQITFRWTAPQDPDGEAIADYQFQLSESLSPFRPLSTNFDALLSYTPHRGTTQFSAPWPGLLNGGQTYYWRVRARDARGCWGPWGGPWPFQVAVPATPASVRAEPEQRALLLKWDGHSPKYRLFGSFHRGFTPHAVPHKILAELGGDRRETLDEPGNLLAETDSPELRIPWNDAARLRPFYRIQALDAQGTPGPWSAQIEVPGPILLTPNPLTLEPGQTTIPLEFLGSKGHLVNLSNDYHRRIALPDTWRITRVRSSEPSEPPLVVRASGQTLNLDHLLAAGERKILHLSVRGTGYFNRGKSGEISLTLMGGGPGKAATSADPSEDSALPDSSGKDALFFRDAPPEDQSPWEIRLDNAAAAFPIEEGTRFFAVQAVNPDQPWSATLEAPLPAEAATGDIVEWSALLLLDTSSWQAGYELTLNEKSGRSITLDLRPWMPARLRDSRGTTTTGKEPFACSYGEPILLRWIIRRADGGSVIQIDDNTLLESPGGAALDTAGGTCRVQLLSREPTTGSLGIGNMHIGSRPNP